MRPQSIVNFERVVLLIVVLMVLGTVLDWEMLVADSARKGVGSTLVMVLAVVSVGIYLLLMWLIAHRRSVAAKWIYVAIAVIGLTMAALSFDSLMRASAVLLVIQVAQILLTLISIWLLFRPDTRPWFGKDASPAP